MKKGSLWSVVALVTTGVLGWVLYTQPGLWNGGLWRGGAGGEKLVRAEQPRRTSADAPPTEPSPRSVYQLSSKWTSDENQTLRLKQLSGSFQIVAMIFTHCPAACPTLVREMQ